MSEADERPSDESLIEVQMAALGEEIDADGIEDEQVFAAYSANLRRLVELAQDERATPEFRRLVVGQLERAAALRDQILQHNRDVEERKRQEGQ